MDAYLQSLKIFSPRQKILNFSELKVGDTFMMLPEYKVFFKLSSTRFGNAVEAHIIEGIDFKVLDLKFNVIYNRTKGNPLSYSDELFMELFEKDYLFSYERKVITHAPGQHLPSPVRLDSQRLGSQTNLE